MELHRSIGLWLFEGHHYNALKVRLLREAFEAGRKWQRGLPRRTFIIDRTDDLCCAVEAYDHCRNNPGAVVRSSTTLVPLASEDEASTERLAHLYVPPNEDLPYPPAVYRAFRRFAEGVQDWLLVAKAGALAQDRPSEPEQGQLSTWYCTTNLWLFYPKDDRADYGAIHASR
jgi:hypothetical protein